MSMKLYEKLNVYLANQQVMYIKLHNIHWNLKGSGFFALHEKTEELYNQTADIIDQVGERILAMGYQPVANMKNVLEMTAVKEREDKPISSEEAVQSMISDLDYWVTDSAEIIKLAEEENDGPTADMFTGYLGKYQKLLWMFNSYVF